MRLVLGKINIKGVEFAPVTKVDNGILMVNQEELASLIKEDSRIANVAIFLAKPGDSTRIIPVKDVIEPRVKVEGPGNVFPGFLGKVDMVGSGRTHVLKGAAVVTTGKIVGFQEGIIDMTGPGAEYTPFSQTYNVVIKAEPVPGLSQHEHESILRIAGFKAAAYLGEAGRNISADEEEIFDVPSIAEALRKYPGLPKVAYVYMLQTQGLLHDTYVYGVDAKRILPTFISPTEVMDGAVVSGNCVSACDKNPTYIHQNNPVIRELFRRHGQDYNFIATIITNENVTLADKERSSSYTAKLAEMIGIDAAIITEEGFGNPDADLVMNCRKLEQKGIKTVLITDEYAGRDGSSQSLADTTPEAAAVVTGGNANETIVLPKLATVIGHQEVADTIAGGFSGSLRSDGSIEVEIQALTGATSEVGFTKLGVNGF
ncbi:MAG: glycine/sarcosine/betaine reductase component B subunit [Veillonellales bacterium]